MEQNRAKTSDNTFRHDSRLPYKKPVLTMFGFVAELTAAGSGGMTEQSNDNTVSCASSKSYVEACMGTPGGG